MKTLTFRLLLVLGVVLASYGIASAQSEIQLGGTTQSVSFDATSSTSASVTFGSCNAGAGTCTLSGGGLATGQPGFSLGTWSLVTNGSGPMTVSNTGSFNSTPGGTFTFTGYVGLQGTLTGNFTINYVAGGSTPTFNINVTNITGTGAVASLFSNGSSATLSYLLSQLMCNSKISGGCTFQNLFSTGNQGIIASDHGVYGGMMPAPEPTAGLLLGTGLLAIGTVLRRRAKTRSNES